MQYGYIYKCLKYALEHQADFLRGGKFYNKLTHVFSEVSYEYLPVTILKHFGIVINKIYAYTKIICNMSGYFCRCKSSRTSRQTRPLPSN